MSLHLLLSSAILMQTDTGSPTQTPTSPLQFLRGRPRPRLPSTPPRMTVWANLPGLLVTCPNNCNFLFFTVSSNGSRSPPFLLISSSTDALVRGSRQCTPSASRMHWSSSRAVCLVTKSNTHTGPPQSLMPSWVGFSFSLALLCTSRCGLTWPLELLR